MSKLKQGPAKDSSNESKCDACQNLDTQSHLMWCLAYATSRVLISTVTKMLSNISRNSSTSVSLNTETE